MDHKAYMYVLECRDGSYYTGYTTDVRRRLAVHNSGKGAKYTRARLPVKLIYAQGFASKEEAMSAEALLKRKKRPQKERFLSENQDRNLLYSMKIKEQTRKLAVDSTWVRQGEADVVWIWFSKSISYFEE